MRSVVLPVVSLRRLLAVVTAVVLLLTLVRVPHARAAFLGKRGVIVVSAATGTKGDHDIWSVTASGDRVLDYTKGDRLNDVSPTFSPEGGPHIAYVGRPIGGGAGHIFVVDRFPPGGATPRPIQLTKGSASDAQPSWSPSGGKIVFTRTPAGGGQPQLWWMSLSGLNQTAIECCRIQGTTPHVVHGREPAWSPDSRTYAYVAPDPTTKQPAIWLMPVDRRAQPEMLTLGTSPNWSPLGDRIVYVFQGDVWTIESDPDQHPVPRLVDAAPAGSRDANPTWSPDSYVFDGTAQGVILFERVSNGKSSLWRTDPNAESPQARRISVGMAAGNPDWQPECNIQGTTHADRLTGTPRPELICGRDGGDQISAGGGSDRVFGGAGADTITVSYGDDYVVAGVGEFADVLTGGPGDDHLEGDFGNDRIYDYGRNSGADIIQGGPGNDAIVAWDGTQGNDSVDGGEDHDTCEVDTPRGVYSPDVDFVWECEGWYKHS